MAVTLTENAARHVNTYLTKRGKGIGLRLGVKTSGCSGMAYELTRKLLFVTKLLSQIQSEE